MKLLLVCLFLVFASQRSLGALHDFVDTFEFGQNYGSISFTTSGSIGLLEKVKRVSVVLPQCTELKYVRVDVNNRFGPPAVKYDWATQTVIMEYSPLQYSVSQYTIIAKTVPTYCGGEPQRQPQHYVPVIGMSL